MNDARCIFLGCVATWEHYHGGFPGATRAALAALEGENHE